MFFKMRILSPVVMDPAYHAPATRTYRNGTQMGFVTRNEYPIPYTFDGNRIKKGGDRCGNLKAHPRATSPTNPLGFYIMHIVDRLRAGDTIDILTIFVYNLSDAVYPTGGG